ncbi:MAG: hypothetical protein AAF500_14705 [Myxococcota bacterium]
MTAVLALCIFGAACGSTEATGGSGGDGAAGGTGGLSGAGGSGGAGGPGGSAGMGGVGGNAGSGGTEDVVRYVPYQPGDERLAVGFFYEGGHSETILPNDTTRNFLVIVDGDDSTTSITDSSDRIEGGVSQQFALTGTSFWGGLVLWEDTIDLSEWTTMFVGFKSSDPSFATFDLTLVSGTRDDPTRVDLDPRAYGYTNDGEWHFLEVPLQDAIDAGFDPTMTRSPFFIGATGGEAGDVLLVDALYFNKD